VHKLSDNMLVDVALPTTVLEDSQATSKYYDMREFDRAAFIADMKVVAGTPSMQIGLRSAEDSVGTNPSDLKIGTPGVIDEDKVAVMEVKAEDLVEGKPWVALVIDNSGFGTICNATIAAALHAPHQAFENKIGADFLYNTWE